MKHNRSGRGLVRRTGRRMIRTISTAALIAALALLGTVPYFHIGGSELPEGTTDPAVYGAETQIAREHHVTPAADIDYDLCPDPDGTSVILMDAKSDQVLYEKNPDEIRDPASITKILNCLVVLDTLDMDMEVTVEIEPETEGSIMELKRGETLTVRDLVYGMMLVSGNDAAEVLAYIAGNGDIDAFCEMMNEKAKELGAENTDYTNPNGLNPAGKKNNTTTARDIAKVAIEAMKIPQFREIVGTVKYRVPATNRSKERKLKNSNRCMWDTKMKVMIDGEKTPVKYEGCIGVKTGYSSTAGDCFCGYVKKGNTRLISVVLNASHEEEKFQDSINIWNYGFDNFRTCTVEKAGRVLGTNKVKGGTLREVDLGLAEDMCITVSKGYDGKNITTEIEVSREKVQAPVSKGQELGQLVAYNEKGSVVGICPLISLEEAGVGGPLTAIGIADEDIIWFITAVTAALLIIVAGIAFAVRRKN